MKNTKLLETSLLNWLPFAFTIILSIGTAYGLAHQTQRQAANDPQIQIAEEIVEYLSRGNPVESLGLTPSTVDLEKSLAFFITVVDSQYNQVASTAFLGTDSPAIPSGVFAEAKLRKQNRVTWEPAKNVRHATVAQYYESGENSGYIVVGKSLREVEKRANSLLIISAVGAAVGLSTSFISVLFWKKQTAKA